MCRTLAFSALFFVVAIAAATRPAQAQPSNILSNGSFEEGIYSPSSWPTDWEWSEWQALSDPIWDDLESFAGDKSVKIHSPIENDARWVQAVDVDPGSHYFLSGWIKTEDAGPIGSDWGAGANLSLLGTWTRSDHLLGTRSWTCNGVRFDSGSESQVSVGARLGHWGGTAAGTAWFD